MAELLEEKEFEELRLRKVQHHCGQVTCNACGEEGQTCWFVSNEDKRYWFLGGVGEDKADKIFWDSLKDPNYRDILTRLALVAGFEWAELEDDIHERLDFLMDMFGQLHELYNYAAFADMLNNIELKDLPKFRRRPDDNATQAINRVRVMYAFPKLQHPKKKKTL